MICVFDVVVDLKVGEYEVIYMIVGILKCGFLFY